MKKLGNEPAFPIETTETDNYGGTYHSQYFGMTKRFYTACHIFSALVSAPQNENAQIGKLVKASYQLADELLKQEAEQ